MGEFDFVGSFGADLLLGPRNLLAHQGTELILRQPTGAALKALALVADLQGLGV